MAKNSVRFRNVFFRYETMQDWLLADVSIHFPEGWTGVVGANGGGKTTLVRLATGELKPWQGIVESAGDAVYCPQRTDEAPGTLWELVESTDGEAVRIRGRLGIEGDWPERWDTLSHGERKRAQIALVLWRRPQVLAVDEPTNHLDMEARHRLHQALREYRGVGLLISHDRELLDGLCSQCIFVDPPSAVARPGGYTQAARQAAQEQESAKRSREIAEQQLSRLRRTAVERREAASRADKRRSKRGLDPGDRDARAKIDLARVTGKDAVAGKLLHQLEGRLRQAEDKVRGIRVKREYKLGIWMPGERSGRNSLVSLPAGELKLGHDKRLRFPDLTILPNDRIAITGPNGAGKSTLVERIVRSANIPPERLVYIPQEIPLDSSRRILAGIRDLSNEERGRMMTVVSRLGSRPSRLLESDEPSPGEARKLLLALGIAKVPLLIVMDEPTNHMDLPSIECVEAALADCPCGLLLVSHDQRFLDKLANIRWNISRPEGGSGVFVLRSEFR